MIPGITFFKKILVRAHARYTPFVTTYPGFTCHVIDKSSFLSMYKEIFERKIYTFKTASSAPVIIDCGANIGLSVIYFKKMYPNARITAFEPDPTVYETLEKNVKNLGLKDVTLVKKGLGSAETKKSFFSEGADGGRIATGHDAGQTISVEIARLSPYIKGHVDFLKIDIEGSELEVLEESQVALKNVDNLFIEYHSLLSKPQELDKILKILSEAGFRYYIESTGVHSEHAFVKISEHLNYDLQLNIFAHRN